MKLIKNLLVALALFTAAGQLDASSVVDVNFDQLSRASDRVVAGEVVSVVADRDANGYIYSTVTIRVAEAVPQELVGTDYTFRMVGGELDDASTYIQGMPRFTAGDGVVLFLTETPDSVLGPTVGLWQGVFFVDTDSSAISDHERQLVTGVQGSRLMRASRTVEPDAVGVAAGDITVQRAMDVGSFMNAVRTARSN
jgi:hypothetical protein